ncbi:WhiB family transcriptional regulator [Streptomyces sp. TRM68367]|nr:WhiB family transcriptional regulator [Streptomyces sp. TRM68367]
MCRGRQHRGRRPTAARGDARALRVTPHRAGPQRSRRCPGRVRCLEWALDTGQSIGIWGGTSETERRALKRWRAASLRSRG